MATVIEEFVARLGWDVDTKEIEKFNKSFDRVKNIALGIGKAVSIATGLITGYATVVGRQIAVNTNLAKSVGISVESLEALGGVVENLGMDTERVVDLVEEMNNKLGEKKGLGEFTAVEESLKILRLDFEAIRKLKPEEQFIQILDAAKALGDQQQAVSAVDMLMGGEANKILGFLRTQEGTLAELIERRKQLILLDADGRKGAVDFAAAMNDVNFVMKSMGGLVFGELGKVLKPMIKDFLDWAAANRKVIRPKLRKFAERLAKAVGFLARVLKKAIVWVWKAIDAVGGFDKALFLLTLTIGAFALSNIIMGVYSFIKAVKAATLVQTLFNAAVAFIPALIALAIIAIGLIAEDLYQFFTGGESLTGDFVEFFKGMWAEMVAVAEGYIADIVDFVYGMWVEMVAVTEGYIADIVKFFEDMWAEMVAVAEGYIADIVKFFEDMWAEMVAVAEGYIDGFFRGFGGFIDGIVDKAVGMFRELKAMAKDSIDFILRLARKMPLIGGLFGEEKTTPVKKATSKPSKTSDTGIFDDQFVLNNQPFALPPPSPSPSVVNSRGNTTVTQTTKVTAPITVNAQPGQSAVDIGREVQRQLGEQVSAAVRANDTGIER